MTYQKPYTFRAGTYAKAAEVNANFDTVKNFVDDLESTILNNQVSNAVYNKANRLNYPGIKKSGLTSAYTLKGKAHYKLEEYALAADAYTKVIENCSYKYTDAYLYRGASKYYAGDIQGALIDFLEHRNIIYKYFEEMKDVTYPTYTQKDLDLVNEWIAVCKR